MDTLPVVAAIPNYNMADSLRELVPALLEQEYAEVFVLDDASTDHSADVAADFGSDITLVRGQENQGSGANRNRIMGALGQEAIIHFIDADMGMETTESPAITRDLMSRPNIGFVGGLIKNPNGRQQCFNFGPRQCFHSDSHAPLQMLIDAVGNQDLERASKLRGRFSRALRDWPNPFEAPVERQVFWAAEANFAISSAVFEELGGFDPKMRSQEILEFSMRLHKLGLEGRFSPLISGLHKAIQVRQGNRNVSDFQSTLHTISKHGVKNYLFPDGRFKPGI